MQDEYLLKTPQLEQFIAEIQAISRSIEDVSERLAAMRPHFSALMADPDWLPAEFRQPAEQSGMGGGIASWLLYRAGDGGLSFFALVVPPGSSTPVHDHLAWGLVGLYRGEQEEEVYSRQDDGATEGQADLRLQARQKLQPGQHGLEGHRQRNCRGVAVHGAMERKHAVGYLRPTATGTKLPAEPGPIVTNPAFYGLTR